MPCWLRRSPSEEKKEKCEWKVLLQMPGQVGAFVRPSVVTVEDFPKEDYGLDEI